MKNAAEALLAQAERHHSIAQWFANNPFGRLVTEDEYRSHFCEGKRCRMCRQWVLQFEQYVDIKKES